MQFNLIEGFTPDFVTQNFKKADLSTLRKVIPMSGKTSLSFKDVFKEMQERVPDKTSTVAEKSLALFYINKMLACKDIPNSDYWKNKKSIVEMEIQNIKNYDKANNSVEKTADVWKDFSKFMNKYLMLDDSVSIDDIFENRMTYYTTYISYCVRLLSCGDITEEQKNEYNRMIKKANTDIKNWKNDYHNSLLYN